MLLLGSALPGFSSLGDISLGTPAEAIRRLRRVTDAPYTGLVETDQGVEIQYLFANATDRPVPSTAKVRSINAIRTFEAESSARKYFDSVKSALRASGDGALHCDDQSTEERRISVRREGVFLSALLSKRDGEVTILERASLDSVPSVCK